MDFDRDCEIMERTRPWHGSANHELREHATATGLRSVVQAIQGQAQEGGRVKTTPGLKRSTEEQLWLLQAEQKWSKESQPNRMVRMYGPREGKQCKDCRFLLRKVLRSGRVFFKCMFVGNTGGPGTDFRAGWDACSKFVPRLQRERTTAGNRVMHCL